MTVQATYEGQTEAKTYDFTVKAKEVVNPDPGEGEGGDTPAEPTTVAMNIFANEGVLNGTSISWTSGDITFTNVKGGTAIRTEDGNHYRVYSGSQVVISTASGKITKVVVTAASDSKYKTPWKASMEAAGYTVTVNGSTYTIEIPDGAEEITFKATAQMRLSKIDVTYVG